VTGQSTVEYTNTLATPTTTVTINGNTGEQV